MGGKRLIVLSGEWGKRALTVENGGGACLIKMQIDCLENRLYLAVRQECERFVSPLKSEVVVPFEVNKEAHFMVVTAGLEVVLYGTASDKRLWQGNMLDGFKGEIARLESEFSESPNPGKVENGVTGGYKVRQGEVNGRKMGEDGAVSCRSVVESGDSSQACGAAEAKAENDSSAAVEYDDFLIAESNYFEENAFVPTKKSLSAFGRAFRVGCKGGSVAGGGASSSVVVESGSFDRVEVERGEGRRVVGVNGGESFPLSDFYERVKGRVDGLFKGGERISALEEALPLTKWVKVPCEGGYYALGTVGEPPDYLCYGLPGRGGAVVPEALEGYARWFPLDVRFPNGEGLWVLYQDARTGESVRLRR